MRYGDGYANTIQALLVRGHKVGFHESDVNSPKVVVVAYNFGRTLKT